MRAQSTLVDRQGNTFPVTGHYCEKISSGCANCYASNFQKRFHMPDFPGHGKPWLQPESPSLWFDESRLLEVLKRKIPTRWFWCDMTDMFGHWVPDEWIDKCFAVMALTPWHTHQVLTKRPDRMLKYLTTDEQYINRRGYIQNQIDHRLAPDNLSMRNVMNVWPLLNVQIGTSAENQAAWDWRVPMLEKCPAAVRFVSVEPMLGSIDARKQFLASCDGCDGSGGYFPFDAQEEEECRRCEGAGVDEAFPMEEIHWIICGGESGPNARVFDPQNAHALMTQCRTAGIPFFFKQMGSNPYDKFNGCKVDILDRKGTEWKGYCDLNVRMFPGDEWPK